MIKAAIVAGVVILTVLYFLFGRTAPGARNSIGFPELILIGAMFVGVLLVMRLISWLSSGSKNDTLKPKPKDGELLPMPNFLIAMKCLAMACFFACPVFFVAMPFIGGGDSTFIVLGCVSPIVGGFIMALVGMIAQSKGYKNDDK